MLLKPRTVAEASGLMAGGAATLLAGGTDVFPALVDRPPPARMIDLSGIAEMRGIVRCSAGTRIGAGCTWSEIIRADLPCGFDGLKAAAREVGSVQIQNRATIGGNLVNASPAADGVPPLLALDAEVELVGRDGARRLPLGAFILGNRKTARRPDEILTAVYVPSEICDSGSAFLKLGARRYLVISIVMVAANILCDEHGRVRVARVAVGAASAVAQRLVVFEQRLIGLHASDLAQVKPSPAELDNLSPIDDARASATYRLEAAQVLVARAVVAAAGDSSHAS